MTSLSRLCCFGSHAYLHAEKIVAASRDVWNGHGRCIAGVQPTPSRLKGRRALRIPSADVTNRRRQGKPAFLRGRFWSKTWSRADGYQLRHVQCTCTSSHLETPCIFLNNGTQKTKQSCVNHTNDIVQLNISSQRGNAVVRRTIFIDEGQVVRWHTVHLCLLLGVTRGMSVL